MNRFTRAASFAAAALLTPAIALAEADEAVGAISSREQGLITGITALLVFFVVLGVLYVKVWPVITKALDERAAKIREEIEAAEQAQKQARAALQQYEKNLADARAEATKMLESTKTQQQQLAAELRAKADVELTAMREKAKRDIDAAKRAAVNEIYAEAVNLSTALASRILQREVRAEDQQRMITESLDELRAAQPA